MNYSKLISQNPTEYGRMTNSAGQTVVFYEHPTRGDEYPVIVAFPQYEVAFTSEFFDTDDMAADHAEYEPIFVDGQLQYGN
jgi:hypothetical protein